jgi:hypothetical protein
MCSNPNTSANVLLIRICHVTGFMTRCVRSHHISQQHSTMVYFRIVLKAALLLQIARTSGFVAGRPCQPQGGKARPTRVAVHQDDVQTMALMLAEIRGVGKQMNKIEINMVDLKKDMVDLKKEVKGDLLAVKGDLLAVKGDLVELKNELKADLLAVKGDLLAVKGDLVELKNELKGDVLAVKGDVLAVKGDLSLKSRMKCSKQDSKFTCYCLLPLLAC